MSSGSIEYCPICDREMEDTRHVAVECSYAVEEFVPSATQVDILKEVPEEGTFWGVTRHYPSGTKDEWDASQDESNVTKITINQVPIEPIRVLENKMYSVTCCKSCRADFLNAFKEWSEGKMVSNGGSGNVPIRVGGTNKFVSVEEFNSMKENNLSYADIVSKREEVLNERVKNN